MTASGQSVPGRGKPSAAMGAGVAMTSNSPWVKPMGDLYERYVHLARPLVYGTGDVIYWQGEPSQGFYYLAKGRIRISLLRDDGSERILAVHEGPAHFGEAAACDGQPHFTSAVALEECHAYLFPVEKLLSIAREKPEIVLDLMRGMARKMRLLTLEVETLACLRAEQRVASMLMKLIHDYGAPTARGKALTLPVTHQELAAVTGMSRVTVTLILNKWEGEGIISKRRGHIEVLDEAHLRRRTG